MPGRFRDALREPEDLRYADETALPPTERNPTTEEVRAFVTTMQLGNDRER